MNVINSSNVSETKATHAPEPPQSPPPPLSSISSSLHTSRESNPGECPVQQPQQHAAASHITVNTSRTLPRRQNVNTVSVGSSRSAHMPTGAHDGDSTATGATLQSSSQELQMVADLKSTLFHTTRQLAQARQQARASEEACSELRQRCQGLEMEKQTLQLELQGAQDRLLARQIRVDEHRREAADAKLHVVSLTAERDELAATLQETWDRVAELRVALASKENEVKKLQEDVTEARHGKELVAQQQTAIESQLRLLQEQLSEGGTNLRAQEVARERLTASLHETVQRLASILSDAAYDYQQSVTQGSGGAFNISSSGSQSDERFLRITAAAMEEVDTSANANHEDPPHVVLSSTARPSPATATTTATASSLFAHRTAGAPRLRAEHLLHAAEAVVWGENAWDWTCENTRSSAIPSASLPHVEQTQQQQNGDATAATPPEHKSSPSVAQEFLVNFRPTRASSSSSQSTLSEQVVVRTVLAPFLLAMKHVAAMLSTVRHEHRRTVAEAEHFHTRYEEAQQQLEEVQKELRSQEMQSGTSHGQILRLQQQTQQAEEALKQYRSEDAQRRTALASVLQCREDWALIQHSVERLLAQQVELQKDMTQLDAARKTVRETTQRYDKYVETSSEGRQLLRRREEEEKIAQRLMSREVHDLRKGIDVTRSSEEGQRPAEAKNGTSFEAPTAAAAFGVGASTRPALSPPSGSRLSVSPSLVVTPQSQHRAEDDVPTLADVATNTRPSFEPANASNGSSLEDRHHETSQAPPSLPLPPHLTASPLVRTPAHTVQWGNHHAATASEKAQGNGVTSAASLEIQPVELSTRPVSRTYPAPVPDASPSAFTSLPPSSSPLHNLTTTGSTLLYSLYGASHKQQQQQQQTSASHDPLSPSPLPVSPSSAPSQQRRHPYRQVNSSNATIGGVNPSSLFAAEVLQVIEALDRRASGALHRTPRS